ncbi:putative lateral flagellar export/assembly protein LafU [Scandinavium goeteborgense]|uniref:Chemotaxis protein MotB n=1 Tax=Scandinavium goeteborgense TaxID=1851514 RepID=A0A4R6E6R0_SCAGO|nr:putative lateral flagellar export/assembly protein LafU [Scandinavium goeteborgense]TDN53581.1 chemotaxis protein MotB [Scandinavium goeteborgense]
MSVRNRPGRRERVPGKTIIRRQVKKGHAAHHGGAWKVAFADFTLAMMALFMTLWIVGSVSKKERAQVVAALYNQSIFHGGGMTPLNNISAAMHPIHSQGMHGALANRIAHANAHHTVANNQLNMPIRSTENTALLKQKNARELGELATTIYNIAQKAKMDANLEIEIVPQGLRVLIKDDKHRQMYSVGSTRISPYFKTLLTQLTPVFDSLDNKMIITGHTDALKYRGGHYSNWNLSGDRALAARQILENAGMPSGKVLQVNAMADQMLLDKAHPKNEANRRIEIMILTKTASDTLKDFFGQDGDKVAHPATPALQSVKAIVPPAPAANIPVAHR